MKRLIVILIVLFLSFGCTYHIKNPEKFDVYPELIPTFDGESPIKVLVPEDAEEKYFVEYADKENPAASKVYVDLNALYKNAKELIEKELMGNGVPLSPEAVKYIKFTITKIEWEVWAGGFSVGSILDFEVETGDGYKRQYQVQDQSSMEVGRAVSGTITRAVEKIYSNKKIIEYIER